jgi:hypothetical protein
MEAAARTCHFSVALLVMIYSGWNLLFAVPSHPIVAIVSFLISLVPLWVGLYAKRKTVFQLLLLGYWF